MATASVRTAEETVEQQVARLLKLWRDETAYLSSSSKITGHPAYLELIHVGPVALPFILRDLDRTRDGHLSKALTAITGAQPIPSEFRGQIATIAEYWLKWAKETGHQW